jgi:hypothetical protein
VFTARCALSPYIKQIRFIFKGLNWIQKGFNTLFQWWSHSGRHALGVTYTNTPFDHIASNGFRTTAFISSRQIISRVMKSGERGGQTIRTFCQHSELQRGHPASHILLHMKRRPPPPRNARTQRVSGKAWRIWASTNRSSPHQARSPRDSVSDKEKEVKMKFNSAQAQNCYENFPEQRPQNLRSILQFINVSTDVSMLRGAY